MISRFEAAVLTNIYEHNQLILKFTFGRNNDGTYCINGKPYSPDLVNLWTNIILALKAIAADSISFEPTWIKKSFNSIDCETKNPQQFLSSCFVENRDFFLDLFKNLKEDSKVVNEIIRQREIDRNSRIVRIPPTFESSIEDLMTLNDEIKFYLFDNPILQFISKRFPQEADLTIFPDLDAAENEVISSGVVITSSETLIREKVDQILMARKRKIITSQGRITKEEATDLLLNYAKKILLIDKLFSIACKELGIQNLMISLWENVILALQVIADEGDIAFVANLSVVPCSNIDCTTNSPHAFLSSCFVSNYDFFMHFFKKLSKDNDLFEEFIEKSMAEEAYINLQTTRFGTVKINMIELSKNSTPYSLICDLSTFCKKIRNYLSRHQPILGTNLFTLHGKKVVKNLEVYSFDEVDEKLFCQAPDVTVRKFDRDCRQANEGTPFNIEEHLKLMEKDKKGNKVWIMSTGTERSIYDLLLSPEDKCEGLIIRDINPQIKAYCDFLVLLLICAKDREDFCKLAGGLESGISLVKYDYFVELLKSEILLRLEEVNISKRMKEYFKDNFETLANCYLSVIHIPVGGDNTGILYWRFDYLFDKLQRYARQGKIIPTVGDINDLGLFNDRTIAVIDTSNISDYTAIMPTGYVNSTPRVIFTQQDPDKTIYISSLYQTTKEELEKITKYMSLFKCHEAVTKFLDELYSSPYAEKNRENRFNAMEHSCFSMRNILKIKNGLNCVLNNMSTTNKFDLAFYVTKGAMEAIINKYNNKEPKTEIELILNDLLNESNPGFIDTPKLIENVEIKSPGKYF